MVSKVYILVFIVSVPFEYDNHCSCYTPVRREPDRGPDEVASLPFKLQLKRTDTETAKLRPWLLLFCSAAVPFYLTIPVLQSYKRRKRSADLRDRTSTHAREEMKLLTDEEIPR